jgi:KUP system potassium uptake protein
MSRWGNLVLAYKTLGVVFGGLVTSPLYVYPSMPLKSPTKEDYLGIYSIMFWTLTLIGVVKYASIAIKADDQGEGITLAWIIVFILLIFMDFLAYLF